MPTPCTEPTFTGSVVLLDPSADAGPQNEPNSTLTGSVVFLDPDDVKNEPSSTLTGSVVFPEPDIDAESNSTLTGCMKFSDDDLEVEDLSMSYIVPAEYDSESGLETVVSGPPDGIQPVSEEPREETTGVVDCVPEDDESEETLKHDSSPPKPRWHAVPAPCPPPVAKKPALRLLPPVSPRPRVSPLPPVAPVPRTSPLPPVPRFEAAGALPRSSREDVSAQRGATVSGAKQASLMPAVPRLSSLPPPPRIPHGLFSRAPANSPPPTRVGLSECSATRELPAAKPDQSEADAVTTPGRRAPASEQVRLRATPSGWEDPSADDRDSVVPVVGRASRRPTKRRNWWALGIAAGALCAVTVFLFGFLVMEARARATQAAETPALIVTVARVGGFRVADVSVFIDGSRQCEAAPCVVSTLSPGFHFITVGAPGHVAPAPRAIRILEGETTNLHFDLMPEKAAAKAAAASIDVSALPTEATLPALPVAAATAPTAQAPVAAPEPAAPAPAPKPAIKFGYLNFNSIPVSNVVVDGRPIGTTPKTSVRVRAGKHSVVFVHSEHGRRAQSVFVAPGARRTVAVRF